VGTHEFLEECKQALGFLVRDYGFSGPEVKLESPGLASVVYRKGLVGVECTYEERDDDISVRIIRLHKGEPPKAYRKNASGLVVREYLTHLLLQRGIRDLGFPNPPAESGLPPHIMRYRRALQGYARLLRTYAQDVLIGSDEILDLVE
jgi:uncharacterized protein YutE (UPF0331/DUF86 family)